MKERVKAAGGKVDGVLRFSIEWNHTGQTNSDYDAHCIEPDKFQIYYGNKLNRYTGGNLDVDIINPVGVAVENITWPVLDKMKDGKYKFLVHNFSKRGGHGGFKAEIEYDGTIYSFDYQKDLRQGEKVEVAVIDFTKAKGLKMVKSLPSSESSKEVWGVKTKDWTKVQMAMLSPNYWDDNQTGNKHYFFMLEKCINPDTPRGFFNEFLRGDLTQHRKVFDALGREMKVEESDVQLSGVGFSSTKSQSVIARVSGNTQQVFKVKF